MRAEETEETGEGEPSPVPSLCSLRKKIPNGYKKDTSL